jgi:ketosteroid isomerase-like protein
MTTSRYANFDALDPFFEIVREGLTGVVDGKHFFDIIADDAIFDFRYNFPGWPLTIQGRANLMDLFSGYGNSIRLHSAGGLVVHRVQDKRTVILEYEVHGKVLSTGVSYDNRFISVVTIENRKIVRWRDYMDSLAAWTALNGNSAPATTSRLPTG